MGNQSSTPTKKDETFKEFTKLPDGMAIEVFSKLPLKEKAAMAKTSMHCYRLFSKHIHAAKCLMLVAHGDQNAADLMLRSNPQLQLLLEPSDVTDYSGRTFKKITPYEYAYWAKDTRMCRMLEAHMDDKTKAQMLKRIDAIERDGLTYKQHDVIIEHSKHFNFTPLITALTRFVQGYDGWFGAGDWGSMRAAWMLVGLAQRDLPVHAAEEYAYPHRSFNPRPLFNEDTLPMNLKFHNYGAPGNYTWFPLLNSDRHVLGVDFAIFRGSSAFGAAGVKLGAMPVRMDDVADVTPAVFDLAAISYLDDLRTDDLKQSRKNLQIRDMKHIPSCF